jgi:hypothetical protein
MLRAGGAVADTAVLRATLVPVTSRKLVSEHRYGIFTVSLLISNDEESTDYIIWSVIGDNENKKDLRQNNYHMFTLPNVKSDFMFA